MSPCPNLVRMRFWLVMAFIASTLLVGPAKADVITFETLPGGGTPADGMAINTQYQAAFGVTFSLEGGGSPVIAEVGPPQTAFQGFNGLPDQPAPGQNVGNFFLTDNGIVSGPPDPLIVSYTKPVASASGVILDIDGGEAWQVQARNALNQVIDTVTLTPSSFNAGDGLAAPWSFGHSANDIFSIRLVYTGTQTNGVGFAWDNFASAPALATPVPEPSSLMMFAVGAIALSRFTRLRRWRTAA
jgi:hypothetical protein